METLTCSEEQHNNYKKNIYVGTINDEMKIIHK